MKYRYIFISMLFLGLSFKGKAQDSAAVVKAFTELISICKNVDFSDPKTLELGTFYKAAPYIVYRGDDVKRKWRSAANYNDPGEKAQVDNTCFQVNQSVNQDSAYQITSYTTQKESEGTWHVLTINYKKKNKERKAIFGYLKVGDKFLLGDID